MYQVPNRTTKRLARVRRIRAKLQGTAMRPRLSVHRSLTTLSAQLINDELGQTILAADSRGLTGKPVEKATLLGKKLADLAKTAGVAQIVFDRRGYKYHGQISSLATALRANGLEF
ncbi:MAG: large subunit ribosomal protein L18 [Candidatus Berkelbacteria bacterium Gr01-1014_85]|uniref:Large ribosomal subunit protein uL18 n=1 Tax=Candidatus Berkelbacteria bacterium Gr01-1014_85 TaxID=2017150 RepID=A0A554JD76_9BACT|nr:MAG: large subunit ribosomal protein L18 [Candidatus Berkelbacteria bacterium Gr01-1014_85]